MKQATPTTLKIEFDLIVDINEDTTKEELSRLNIEAMARVSEHLFALKYSFSQVSNFKLTQAD